MNELLFLGERYAAIMGGRLSLPADVAEGLAEAGRDRLFVYGSWETPGETQGWNYLILSPFPYSEPRRRPARVEGGGISIPKRLLPAIASYQAAVVGTVQRLELWNPEDWERSKGRWIEAYLDAAEEISWA